jgi:hypothetical protein
MSIEYTYEIVNVDEAARCMEIIYSADGHQTMHIGARLPYVGETLEAVVAMYSPVAYWEQQAQPVVLPQVGASGTVTPTTVEQPESTIPTFSVDEVSP